MVLIQDGWSVIHNTPVIATRLQCEGKSYFLSAIDAGTNRTTAAYCTSVAQEAIPTATEHYQCTVTGVVTDNEKKMVAMKQNLHDSNPKLTVYGCASLWLNLLGQDITPAQVIHQVVEINKYFRNQHIPGTLLSETPDSVKSQLPAETRWNSQLTCIRNRPYMLMIIARIKSSSTAEYAASSTTLACSMKLNIYDYNSILCPMHSPDYNQMVPPLLMPVRHGLTCYRTQTYKDKVLHRFEQAMTPTHYLANILHPQYRGKLLLTDQ